MTDNRHANASIQPINKALAAMRWSRLSKRDRLAWFAILAAIIVLIAGWILG